MTPTTMLLRYFDTDHLPGHLAAVSAPFGDLARQIADRTAGPETTTALRKLLEAKDCAVRAHLHEQIDRAERAPAPGEPGYAEDQARRAAGR